jgi:hypothetical protein
MENKEVLLKPSPNKRVYDELDALFSKLLFGIVKIEVRLHKGIIKSLKLYGKEQRHFKEQRKY